MCQLGPIYRATMRQDPWLLHWSLAVMFVAVPFQRNGGGLRVVSAQIQECHEQCAKCHLFDYNKEWHCVECKPGYKLWVDGCFELCPRTFFRYGYECQQCGMYCDECV